MTIAFVFPGQGSQALGMQSDLATTCSAVQSTYGEASEVLGYDLWQLVQVGPVERLNETVITQPAMLTAGVAAWRAWKDAGGPDPGQMAGHSLGEYSALVCSSALQFADAVGLVQKRAQLMQEAVPGGEGVMAAILGLDDETILDVCETASAIGVAESVNFNAPGQVVVAGHRSALENVINLAKEAGARRAIMLNVSVPSHSSLMQPAGEALGEYLDAVEFSRPRINVINSVDGTPYDSAEMMSGQLQRQVFSPVRWVHTVNQMLKDGATSLIECGPGKVLAGLNKRISRTTPIGFIDTPDSMNKALELAEY